MMSRNIPNKPHPTPDPDRPHSSSIHKEKLAAVSAETMPSEQPAGEESGFDSCFDDLGVILTKSIQQPDPDPNLESPGDEGAGARVQQREPGLASEAEPNRPPRTSEIFRLVGAHMAGTVDPVALS